MKCAIFEEHSSSCVVYFRFSGTLFPVSMLDGDTTINVSYSFDPDQPWNFAMPDLGPYCLQSLSTFSCQNLGRIT